jgi:hypothetical protein
VAARVGTLGSAPILCPRTPRPLPSIEMLAVAAIMHARAGITQMAKCFVCGAETELRVAQVAVCVDCDAKDAQFPKVETLRDITLPVSDSPEPST